MSSASSARWRSVDNMEWNDMINSAIMALAITLITAVIVRSYFSVLSLYNMFSLWL
jgi:hypothetical protein